jgi:hypothetical protein
MDKEQLAKLKELEDWLNDRRPQHLAIQDFLYIYVAIHQFADGSGHIAIYYNFPDADQHWPITSEYPFEEVLQSIYEYYKYYLDCAECGDSLAGLNKCPNCSDGKPEIHYSVFEKECEI